MVYFYWNTRPTKAFLSCTYWVRKSVWQTLLFSLHRGSFSQIFSLLHAAHRELLYVASVSIRSMTVELKPHRPRGESRPTSALASVWLFCVTSAVIFWFHVLHVTAAAPHNPLFLPSHLKSQENVSSEVKAYV